jgi:hypothetical protein
MATHATRLGVVGLLVACGFSGGAMASMFDPGSSAGASEGSTDRVEERSELAAGLSFVECMRSHGDTPRATLAIWLDAHLVQPGRISPPPVILERGVGAVPLYGRRGADPHSIGRLLRAALERVITTLRGLLATPQDDRFVATAIHSGRVTRMQGARGTRWVAHPSVADNLSDIVLSLFVVDLLHHRELYDSALSVCDECGRVGFDASGLIRRRCSAHRDPLLALRSAG